MSAAFPDGFLFGAAVGAHQVEGGNTNSDWWWWEHREGSPCEEPSGDACDFYHRYEHDISMLAGFGLNAFRFGIEWSRIEPAEGEFSTAALDHYGRMLDACHEHGVVPVLTFHHFTLPRWLHDLGGFTHDGFPRLFERYCERAARALGARIGYACTLNEPQGLGWSGWVSGINPPGLKNDLVAARRVAENLLEAHRLAAPAIRAHTKAPVGVTLAIPDLQYEEGAAPGQTGLEVESGINDEFFELAREDDFIGVQTYTRVRYGPDGPRELTGADEVTQMGYEYYPRALGGAIRRTCEATGGRVPILVTENGIATTDDERRIAFMTEALDEVRKCLAGGIDVRSYIHWSLLDNFEWGFGYGPKFGLVAVDRETFERHPKRSARWLGARALESR